VNTLLAQDDVDGIVITHGTDTIEAFVTMRYSIARRGLAG
jgi:L-asparaginase/Glu-tRNA(Gln) amidotransferase subunit D